VEHWNLDCELHRSWFHFCITNLVGCCEMRWFYPLYFRETLIVFWLTQFFISAYLTFICTHVMLEQINNGYLFVQWHYTSRKLWYLGIETMVVYSFSDITRVTNCGILVLNNGCIFVQRHYVNRTLWYPGIETMAV